MRRAIQAIEAVGRYAIERLLGAGSMGSVYLAFDTRLRRRVALKVLGADAPAIGADAVAVALREARAASAITHPNATAVFDADEADGRAFIVMEYVPGTPLRRFVGDPSWMIATRLRWLVEIAGALAAAHAVGVVHRDVKPENVMVRDDGVAKVLDFGVARTPGLEEAASAELGGAAAAGFSTWTQDGGFVGTPGYMAPEALRGQEVDGRADQFGWGVLAYELLAGRLPWRRADGAFGAIASVLTDTPERLGPEVPPAVADAVARALEKVPEGRFSSLVEAAAAIAPFAEPSPLSPLSGSRSIAPQRASAPELLVTPTGTLASPGVEPPPPPSPPPLPATLRSLDTPPRRGPMPSSPGGSEPPPPDLPPPRERMSSAVIVRGFREPDFTAPVDLEAHVALLPPGATSKGMFSTDLIALAASVRTHAELSASAGIPVRRYLPFFDYPMAESLRLTVAVARAVYPDLPLGEALRRIGQRVFDVALSSHFGRTIFGALGRDPEVFLLQGPKLYRRLLGFGEFTGEKVGPGEFLMRARGLPLFLETHHVGVFEGVLRYCQTRVQVAIDLESLDCATLRLRLDDFG